MWLDRFLNDFLTVEHKSMADAPPAPKAGLRTAPRVRISQSERLLRAVTALAGQGAELLSHTEQPWASVTFAGTRHTIVLRYEGWEACDAAELLIAALPEHEFEIPRTLVADATVARLDQVVLPEPMMTVELMMLLLDDA